MSVSMEEPVSGSRGPEALLAHEGRWVTDLGKWFPAERVVFRGKDLHHDLRDMSWTALLLYAVTGREFDAKQVRLLEALCTLTVSYPDPSIWPNHVAALAGTARSTGVLGVAAAVATQEAQVYGAGPLVEGADFLVETRRRVAEGASLREIVRRELRGRRRVPCFGRPIVSTDERIAPILALACELGLAGGPHLALLSAVQEVLSGQLGRWAMTPSVGAVIATLAMDAGLSPRELYNYFIVGFGIGYVACYTDAESKPEGAFFPLRCDRVKYEGAPRRRWSGPR